MNGRVALVTGGGRGIGARGRAAAGGSGRARHGRVAQRDGTGGRWPRIRCCPSRHRRGLRPGRCRDRATHWPIDVLVVNHGIGSAHERLVWEQYPEVWRETMRINLDGPFELARLTVGGMCKRGFGRLVFTSSTAGEKAERSGQRVHRFQAWGHRACTCSRPGRGALRSHIKRCSTWLGANGHGRALGKNGSRTARHQRRACVAASAPPSTRRAAFWSRARSRR